jgi:mono/diheme cytochrome c family protein
MRRRNLVVRVTGLIGVVAMGILVISGAGNAQKNASLLRYDEPAIIALGAELYLQSCASCHGANLEGQENWRERGVDRLMLAPPHDANGHTWHHPDELLIAITTLGSAAVIGNGYESTMIGFGDTLSEADVIAILSYIKSTWPDEVIEIHNQINAEANG